MFAKSRTEALPNIGKKWTDLEEQQLLNELEIQSNDEYQRSQINNFKDKISKFKAQVKSLTTKSNSMYNLVVRLKELNEELFNKSVINKSEYTIKIIQENFLKL